MRPRVNRLLDFIERVGWTAVQVGAGVAIEHMTNDGQIGWGAIRNAVIIAALKVVVAQRAVGESGAGDLLPGKEVIEPPPAEE